MNSMYELTHAKIFRFNLTSLVGKWLFQKSSYLNFRGCACIARKKVMHIVRICLKASAREKKRAPERRSFGLIHCQERSSTAKRKYRIIEILVRGIMHEGARGHAINVHLRRDPRKDTAFLMHTSGLPRGYY